MSIYLCLSIYVYLSMSIHLCLSIYVYLSMSIYLCLSIYVYLSMFIYLSMSIYLCLCLSIYVYANGVDNDPSEFANFPCCLMYMPQLLGSCHALSVSGGGGGRVGWGGWGGTITSLVRPHIRDAMWCNSTVRSLALHPYTYISHATFLALAHRLDATS